MHKKCKQRDMVDCCGYWSKLLRTLKEMYIDGKYTYTDID